MSAILSALIYTIVFSFLALIYKDLRNKNVESVGVMAIAGICVPVWVFLGWWLSRFSTFVSTNTYWVSLSIWVVVVFFLNLAGKYLYRYKSLTELKSYGLAVGLIFGLLADLFYFQRSLAMPTLFAALLLLTGGLLLTNHSLRKRARRSISWARLFLIIVMNSVFLVIAMSTYKIGVSIQENVLFQVIFTQSLLYTAFFFIGFSSLKKNLLNKKITIKHILGIFSLLLIGTVFEAYTVQAFPVIILVLLTVIPLVIFSFYDFKSKELAFSTKSIIALALVFAGLILTQF